MQKLNSKWNESRLFRLLAALLLNAIVLGFIVLIVNVGFESNDDLTLAAFVDGQMSKPDAHIPYINYLYGLVLKFIYDVFGRGMPWYTIAQYKFILLSFTAVSFVLFERLRFWQGAVLSVILLLFFGVDVYTIISYTKTAGLCAVGGMLLLTHAMGDVKERGWRIGLCVAGIILCLVGFMLRPLEFLPCFGIMAVLSLRWFYGLIFIEKAAVKLKIRRFLHYALPFVLVLVLCAGLYAFDEAAWSKEPWSVYHDYDAQRVAYSDYGRPQYHEMPEAYEALGLSETSVRLLFGGNYFDTEVFTGDLMDSISAVRDEVFPPPGLGECLGIFLDQCLMGFFRNLHVYGFLIVLAFWLAAGEHKLRDWLTVAGTFGLFALMYFYLIYRGRYLIDRVDVALFMALAACMIYMLNPDKLQREKTLAAFLLLFAIGASYYLNRGAYRSQGEYIDRETRSVVETLLDDEEHVYLAKLDTVSDRIYSSPFETPLPGYWDKIVLLGGFDPNHPAIMENLKNYGVENPYRDIVNNNKVYIIEDDIDLTLSHIHEFYDADAYAQLVEPMSSDTGLMIYRILS
ncbi:MAG: hypothetical protein IJE09_03995 [Oscillospiraceae bacterium]|nr:hypothetical protein [Oscillospiraceae bacterium]